MSEISSSLSMNSGRAAASFVGRSATAAVAEVPPANDSDTPTAPSAGTTFFRRFRFEACFVNGM
jgi:hypothetical protein